MLPLIGSRDYLARLIKHLQSHLPDNFALDKNIFLGILLSLIAGQRNLIVDVDVDGEDGFDEDSVELKEQEGRGSSKKVKERRLQDRLERVSLMCETICSAIFDVTCRSSRISSRWTAGELPCAVFPPVPLPTASIPIREGSARANMEPDKRGDPSTPKVPPPRFKPDTHHHHNESIQVNPTEAVLSPPNKPHTATSSDNHHTLAQTVDVDVDNATVSSDHSTATTRSNPSIYGDDEAELDIPQVLVVRGLEDARHGVHLKLLEMLEERRVKWVEDYIVNPASVDGDESVDPLARPEEGANETDLNLCLRALS